MRAKQASCFHCGADAELPFSVKVAQKEKAFCCKGCVCACLVIHDAGAYGASMSSNYNTRPLIAEVLVDGDQARLIRRRQTVEELLALELGL